MLGDMEEAWLIANCLHKPKLIFIFISLCRPLPVKTIKYEIWGIVRVFLSESVVREKKKGNILGILFFFKWNTVNKN